MKIAFINDSAERFGVEYISAVLKAGGHEVKLFVDPQLFDEENISIKWLSRIFDYKKRLISDLKAYKPDLIGISVVTDFYQWACTIARMAKQEMDCPIIFGGIHPTSVPERVIKNDFVDMVCVGEGEYPMLELANSLKRGEIDYSVKNIWFKKDGRIIQNEIRPLIEDLDSLPMPDKELYYSASPHFAKAAYYIMTSRGCAYVCSYCCHSYLKKLYKNKGNYMRYRSIDNVIEELLKAKENYDIKLIRFWDDCFPINTEWLKEFTEKYKKKINLPFICYMYPNHVSLESIKYLKAAGCCEINLGIQSWGEDIRCNILNRRMANKEIERILDAINDKNISIAIDNIIGIFGQSEEEIIELVRFCHKRKNVKAIYFFWLRYFPNFDITIEARKRGYLESSKFEKIMDGRSSRPFGIGGDVLNNNLKRLMILFLLMKLLPKIISEYLIKKKIYRFFPACYPLGVWFLFYAFFSPSLEFKYFRKNDHCRYLHFIKGKLGG